MSVTDPDFDPDTAPDVLAVGEFRCGCGGLTFSIGDGSTHPFRVRCPICHTVAEIVVRGPNSEGGDGS